MISLIRLCCIILLLTLSTLIYADDYASTPPQLSLEDIANATKPTAKNQLEIPLTQEIADEINHLRADAAARKKLLDAIQRMKIEQPKIQKYLTEYRLPPEFLALPLALSNYTTPGKVRDPGPAGIWAITMKQADEYGLIIDDSRDDRFNTPRATEMMFVYFTDLYNEFKDWLLVVTAAKIGEKQTKQLIAASNPHDAWTLARSTIAPVGFMQFLTQFSAYALIIRQPELITTNLAPSRIGD
ncbi:MAG: transglycosylase SLT domain-containing protein [Gammaproteobacteria bacterium]